MNDYDSDLALGLLKKQGYEQTEDESQADVILFNTCSVRQHAEDRVFNQISYLKKEKERRPELMIGVMGCMVENYKTQFFDDFPHIDLLIGTRSIRELPQAIERARNEKQKVIELSKSGFGYDLYETPRREGKFHAYLPIMTGCDKVCSFCIVPYVRGPEISRPSKEILETVKYLADQGVKHITLLGQNVNSYGRSLRAKRPPKDGSVQHRLAESNLGSEIVSASLGMLPRNDDNFSDLLANVAQVNGIEKVSFTTSHPQDAHEALFQAIRQEPKISRRFHLPLQAGSDRILALMRRDHTLAEFRTKIDRMRQLVPDISVTTDIIVGFPGETDEEFEMTRRALEEIEFDGAFIFRYSPRPHTGAARLEDTTPEDLKTKRVSALLEMQRRITQRNNQSLLGTTCQVMVTEISKKSKEEVLARNWQEKKVVFPGTANDIGRICYVKLNELVDETFRGVRPRPDPTFREI